MTRSDINLVSHDLCPYVQRSVITLLEKEIAHARTYIDLSNKPEWFLEVSPLGKVPVLLVGGRALFESAVICDYLDEITPGSLHPDDPLQKAQHRAWIEFGSSILNEIAAFYNAPTQEAFDRRRAAMGDKFAWLERHLGDGPYFENARFSLVDATYGPIFRYFDVFDSIADLGVFSKTPKVRRWRRALRDRSSVREAAVAGYPERLLDFLRKRQSFISTQIP